MSTEKEKIQVIVNGCYYSTASSLKESLGHIASVGLGKLEWMSDSGMRDYITGAIELVEEMLVHVKDARTKRHITNIKKYLENDLNREQLMKLYIEIIMSSEGLTTLTGFRVANVTKSGGRSKTTAVLNLNPEKSTINYK